MLKSCVSFFCIIELRIRTAKKRFTIRNFLLINSFEKLKNLLFQDFILILAVVDMGVVFFRKI